MAFTLELAKQFETGVYDLLVVIPPFFRHF